MAQIKSADDRVKLLDAVKARSMIRSLYRATKAAEATYDSCNFQFVSTVKP
jgi:hypothetical protein